MSGFKTASILGWTTVSSGCFSSVAALLSLSPSPAPLLVPVGCWFVDVDCGSDDEVVDSSSVVDVVVDGVVVVVDVALLTAFVELVVVGLVEAAVSFVTLDSGGWHS